LCEIAQREQARLAKRSEGGALVIPQGPRLGQEAISVSGLAMEMEGRRLFSNVNFRIDEGNILGMYC
jgi:ATPase subunit of ABC transporter with duplicated ATPase domains